MDTLKEQEILGMHKAGLLPATIAIEAEISEALVKKVLKTHHEEPNMKVIGAHDEDIAKAYTLGVPVPEILSKFGLTYTKLYSSLARTETPLRKAETKPIQQQRLAQAVQMYKDEAPLWRIKAETGIAQPTLHAELHKLEVPLRRPR